MYAGTATLVSKETLSDRTVNLTFTLEEELDYTPGQFITFFLERDGKKLPRSYSILKTEGKNVVLCTKLVEGGVASEVFLAANPGEEFFVRGAFGNFVYKEDNNPHVWFIATDTGVVPFYNIIMHTDACEKNATLLFGARNTSELYFNDEFVSLEVQGKLNYLPTLTREDWDGLTGRVQTHLPADCSETTFYICGRKEMVLETVQALKEKGVPDENIKVERYD